MGGNLAQLVDILMWENREKTGGGIMKFFDSQKKLEAQFRPFVREKSVQQL